MDKAVVTHALRLLGRSRKNLRKGRTLFDKTIRASAQNNQSVHLLHHKGMHLTKPEL